MNNAGRGRWGGVLILVAFIVIVRWGADGPNVLHPSEGSSPWDALIFSSVILVLIALIVGIVLVGLLQRGKRRNSAVAIAYPNALLVVATRTADMQIGLRVLAPELRLHTWFAWAVHGGGVSLWQGGRRPVELLTVPWTDIAAVQSLRLDIGRRQFAACSLVITTGEGAVAHLPFLIREADRPIVPVGRTKVDQIAARIQARAPSNASE